MLSFVSHLSVYSCVCFISTDISIGISALSWGWIQWFLYWVDGSTKAANVDDWTLYDKFNFMHNCLQVEKKRLLGARPKGKTIKFYDFYNGLFHLNVVWKCEWTQISHCSLCKVCEVCGRSRVNVEFVRCLFRTIVAVVCHFQVDNLFKFFQWMHLNYQNWCRSKAWLCWDPFFLDFYFCSFPFTSWAFAETKHRTFHFVFMKCPSFCNEKADTIHTFT